MSPAGQTEKEQSEGEIKTGRVGSIVCSALSYCVRTGELAGDVECDEVFPNNDIRHTVTIVSYLKKITKRRCYISHSPR